MVWWLRRGFPSTLHKNQGFKSKSKPSIQTTNSGLPDIGSLLPSYAASLKSLTPMSHPSIQQISIDVGVLDTVPVRFHDSTGSPFSETRQSAIHHFEVQPAHPKSVCLSSVFPFGSVLGSNCLKQPVAFAIC